MRHTITLFCIALLLVSCNSVKRNQKFLSSGNYDQAIELAVKKLQRDKDSKKGAQHIKLLETAFEKAVKRDKKRINFLVKENSVRSIREVYNLYYELDYRQDLLRPLLPLYSSSLGRNASFKMENYSDAIIASRDNLVVALYNQAEYLVAQDDKIAYREAYELTAELLELNPQYDGALSLQALAEEKGTDFVYVTLQNRTGVLIPYRLEQDLLDFSTYNLDDFWTQYHNERLNTVDYTFGVGLAFTDIGISPERILEKEHVRKKRIKTGWEYKKDREGNVMMDSLGNKIKVDIFENVRARVTYTTQTKSVGVAGNVVYRNLKDRRDINSFPLSSEFIFENIFVKYRGDKRALTDEDNDFTRNDFIPFPSNEQMVYDAGEDIKLRLTEILKRNSFR